MSIVVYFDISDPFSINKIIQIENHAYPSSLAKSHIINNINNSYSLIVDVWLADFDLFLTPSPGNNKYLNETQKVSMLLKCLKLTIFSHINLPEEELICFLWRKTKETIIIIATVITIWDKTTAVQLTSKTNNLTNRNWGPY